MTNEAEIILPHLRGACVTVQDRVHILFRMTGYPSKPRPRKLENGSADIFAGRPAKGAG